VPSVRLQNCLFSMYRFTMSEMEGQSTWLNRRTARLLQGRTGDMQLCCSQDRFAPETIQLLLCRGTQMKE